jgi:glutamate-1-semialdehyde 2,1-aminomutase
MREDLPKTAHDYDALARDLLAGGVLHHLSADPALRPPAVMVRGAGSHMVDSRGRAYIDYYLGSASLILGHAHPEVVAAVVDQVARGAHFYEIAPATLELAELVIAAVPSAERIKYAMSGTEAVGAAVRVARAHTGKDKFLKFEGAYHGSNEWMLWGYRHAQRFDYPRARPDSRGIPEGLGDYVLVAPYNDIETMRAILVEHRHELAAVVAEPFLGNIAPRPGFLEALRELTRELAIPLIFDEVVTGFRLAMGGAQAYYGVTPDMTALGKSLGGGHPIGALVGRADLMEYFSAEHVQRGEAVLHVGTFSGNPVSCAAGVATLKVLLRPGAFERLHALGQRLGDGLREISVRLSRETFVMNAGPTVDLWFTDRPVQAYPDNFHADGALARRFRLGLVERGIWAPPGHKMFLSLAHSDEDIAATLQAAEESMRSL